LDHKAIGKTKNIKANLNLRPWERRRDNRMLVLSRKVGERIRIAEDIVVVITAIKGDRIKIGIEAPESVRILRGELLNTDNLHDNCNGTHPLVG
jgi:carbon storage regulator